MKKDILIIYSNGARGDFLNSILIGDKLTRSYESLQILNGGNDSRVPLKKMHRFGDSYQCSIQNIDDLKNYCTVRITVDNIKDAYLIACMEFYKHAVVEKQPRVVELFALDFDYQIRKLQDKAQLVWEIELQYREIDQYIDHRIPFWDLFDVSMIDNFYYQVNTERLSAEEKDRIQYNIDINLVLIEQLRITYMVDTQS
jgi:hypothetical protein